MTVDDERLASLSARRRELYAQLQASRAGKSRQRVSPIVRLRPGPGPGRLVLLHPSGGALFCYTPLVRALRPDIDVIGVVADPASNDFDLSTRMVKVATSTLAALAAIVDPASCVFSGWSHGGCLAFEIARQHAIATGKPPSVVLLDCVYYGDVPTVDEATSLCNFVRDLARLAGAVEAEVIATLDRVEPMSMSLRELLEVTGVNVDLTDAELAERYRTFQYCSDSLTQYRPDAPFPGPVTLLGTEELHIIEPFWRVMVTGPLRSVKVPGDHYTMFTPEHLPIVVSAMHEAADAMAAPTDRRWS
jgi:thioesterase domain-containing protein